MRALYIHISGLAGLLVFLKEVLNYAPLERTILVSATTGLTVYLMLIVGHTIVRRIMAYTPPVAASKGNGASSSPDANGQPKPAAAADAAAADADAAAENAPPASKEAPDADAPASEAETPAAEAAAADRAPQADDRQEPESSESSLAQTTV